LIFLFIYIRQQVKQATRKQQAFKMNQTQLFTMAAEIVDNLSILQGQQREFAMFYLNHVTMSMNKAEISKVEAPKPKAKVEALKPKAPEPKAEASKSKVEALKPKAPEPKAEAPKPKVEAPKLKASKSWADYDDDDDVFQPKTIKSKVEEPKVEEPKATKPKVTWGDDNDDTSPTFCDIASKKVDEQVIESQFKPVTKFKSFQKKTKKVMKNPVFQFDEKLDIDVATCAEHYIMAIREKMKIGIDYQIAPEGHCEYTLQGKLCPNVRECGLIHIKRCQFDISNDTECTRQGCTFLHERDMPNEEAKKEYIATMNSYLSLVNA
jgi:hypothetical protein